MLITGAADQVYSAGRLYACTAVAEGRVIEIGVGTIRQISRAVTMQMPESKMAAVLMREEWVYTVVPGFVSGAVAHSLMFKQVNGQSANAYQRGRAESPSCAIAAAVDFSWRYILNLFIDYPIIAPAVVYVVLGRLAASDPIPAL